MAMAASNNNPTVLFDPSTSKYLVFCGGLTIETTITDKASMVEGWIEDVSTTYGGKERVVGLDTEWWKRAEKSRFKIVILQLCIENKCLIIQMFRMKNIPQSLRRFLMESEFEFVGVGVMNDLSMLKKNYGLESNKGKDVAVLAKDKWPDRISSGSLKYLAKELVGLDMKKSKTVSISDWKSEELTLEQVEYACIDAYVSFKIGQMIFNS